MSGGFCHLCVKDMGQTAAASLSPLPPADSECLSLLSIYCQIIFTPSLGLISVSAPGVTKAGQRVYLGFLSFCNHIEETQPLEYRSSICLKL